MSHSYATNRNREYHKLSKRLLALTNKSLNEPLTVEELAERDELKARIDDLGDQGVGEHHGGHRDKAKEKIRERRRERHNYDYDE